jgi:hypothetical protein
VLLDDHVFETCRFFAERLTSQVPDELAVPWGDAIAWPSLALRERITSSGSGSRGCLTVDDFTVFA